MNALNEIKTYTKNKDTIQMSQSQGLSQRITQLGTDGRQLIDDSCISEKTLNDAMDEIIPYATSKIAELGGTVKHLKKMSLYDCQLCFEKVGGPAPNESNKNVFMKPDGGILVAEIYGKNIPILIVEDKVQGTNDLLFAQGKKRQATGNAIERGAKNIRGAEMLCVEYDFFPYVLFASGCDFHHTETISKRIEMMNMGYPNHSIYIDVGMTAEDVSRQVEEILLPRINIQKQCGHSIASVFVKSHKWNELPHGTSLWHKPDIVKICRRVIDNAVCLLAKYKV